MNPAALIAMMEQELVAMGFSPLKSSGAVRNHMTHHQEGTTLLFVNSMCGCATTGARIGMKMALSESNNLPDHLITVFSSVDEAAATEVFEYTKPYPPSSPAIALFKDGILIHFTERYQLKGTPPEIIAHEWQRVLGEHCRKADVA